MLCFPVSSFHVIWSFDAMVVDDNGVMVVRNNEVIPILRRILLPMVGLLQHTLVATSLSKGKWRRNEVDIVVVAFFVVYFHLFGRVDSPVEILLLLLLLVLLLFIIVLTTTTTITIICYHDCQSGTTNYYLSMFLLLMLLPLLLLPPNMLLPLFCLSCMYSVTIFTANVATSLGGGAINIRNTPTSIGG